MVKTNYLLTMFIRLEDLDLNSGNDYFLISKTSLFRLNYTKESLHPPLFSLSASFLNFR